MAATPIPDLSQVKAWNPDYLEQAATQWSSAATTWDDAYAEAFRQAQSPGGTVWTGDAADAAIETVGLDKVQVVGATDALHAAAAAARTGAGELCAAQQSVLEAVSAAESAGFIVGEDYSVTPRQTGAPPALRAVLHAPAETFAATIRERVLDLAALDHGVAAQITTAAAGLQAINFGAKPSPHDGHDPSIQLVDNRIPLPEKPYPPPEPPPGGWSDDPITRAAQKIAQGHAFGKHGADDFPGMSQDQLAKTVEDLMRRSGTDPSLIVGKTPNNGVAIYDPKTNTLVIRDLRPNATQAGTVFKPSAPDVQKYLEGKIPVRTALNPGDFADGALPPPAPVKPPPPPVEPPMEGAPRVGGVPIAGGPGTPIGPTLVPPPHSIHHMPIIGEDDPDAPWEYEP